MGWLFIRGTNRKWMIEHICKGWENKENNHRTRCISKNYKGSSFKGTLWSLWQIEKIDNNRYSILDEKGPETERFICCHLMEWSKRDDGWGYKDMEESMGPYYYNCPMRYLKEAPVANKEWRKRVLNYHINRKIKLSNRLNRRIILDKEKMIRDLMEKMGIKKEEESA